MRRAPFVWRTSLWIAPRQDFPATMYPRSKRCSTYLEGVGPTGMLLIRSFKGFGVSCPPSTTGFRTPPPSTIRFWASREEDDEEVEQGERQQQSILHALSLLQAGLEDTMMSVSVGLLHRCTWLQYEISTPQARPLSPIIQDSSNSPLPAPVAPTAILSMVSSSDNSMIDCRRDLAPLQDVGGCRR